MGNDMKIYIELMKEQDATDLFKFERDNRIFFEKMVPSRGEDYYIFKKFKDRHSELLKEQEEGLSYFYLIRNSFNLIVGRINLVDLKKDEKCGYVGYRVGESYTGKGIANNALKLLLKEVEKYDILVLHGKTTSNNVVSQKVLEKNHFKQKHIKYEEFESNGRKERFIHYIWEKQDK